MGSGDDTAANWVKFQCRDMQSNLNAEVLNMPPGHGLFGTFGGWSDHCGLSRLCNWRNIKSLSKKTYQFWIKLTSIVFIQLSLPFQTKMEMSFLDKLLIFRL